MKQAVGSAFKTKDKTWYGPGTTGQLMARSQLKDHSVSFGEVYANEIAREQFEVENPAFPVGSIIVREKNALADSPAPEVVIAMLKRERGFSPDTSDWEFVVFDGADLKLKQRETKGNCATCHASAYKTDWVFRDYLDSK